MKQLHLSMDHATISSHFKHDLIGWIYYVTRLLPENKNLSSSLIAKIQTSIMLKETFRYITQPIIHTTLQIYYTYEPSNFTGEIVKQLLPSMYNNSQITHTYHFLVQVWFVWLRIFSYQGSTMTNLTWSRIRD